MLGILSLSTGSVLDIAVAPWAGKGTGEHSLLRQLLHTLNEGDVLLGDAYFASYFLLAALMQLKIDGLCAAHAARHLDFRTGKRLGKGDHLVAWRRPAKPNWMSKEDYQAFPEVIEIRETRVVLKKPGFRDKIIILVSTFRDAQSVTPNDLSLLYSYRWFVELDLRSIKTIMRMDILRGKTPQMVRKEIWAHLLAYNLVRREMLKAAIKHDKNPREMSFKLALQLMGAFLQAGVLENPESYERFLSALVTIKVGNRKRHAEPRMVKRRPKPFPRLQASRHLYRRKCV